ncbi:MAG: hypothetical protein WBF52_06775, partial [Geitlerinemataceae cyanobacterium]
MTPSLSRASTRSNPTSQGSKSQTIPPLLGASLEQLTTWVQQQEQPAYRGKQLYQWLYQQGARSLCDITVFPKQWREKRANVEIGRSTIHHRSVAPDKTIK